MTEARHTDRRRLRGEKSRAQVLAQSILIASKDGLEGLTIGRVASEAGVGKGNIQVLFGDKEALQLATLDRGIELYKTQVVKPALEQASPLARLKLLSDGWYEFVSNRSLPGGCLLNAVSSEYRARPGPIRDRIGELRRESRERLRELISEAKRNGEIDTHADTERLVFELLAYQATANVAALMDDDAEFTLARLVSRERIAAVTCESPADEDPH